jgi:hypothetical protein
VRALCLLLLLINVVALVAWRPNTADGGASQTLPASLPRTLLASEAPPKPPDRCVSIGPFRDERELAAANNLLREVGYVPRNRGATMEAADGYLVVLSDLRNTTQLDNAMRRLRRGGLTDAALLADGGPGIRVSVGVFSEMARAQRRAEVVRKMGLKADVMERLGEVEVSWLDIDLRSTGEDLDPATLQSEGGSLEVKPCPAPAAAGEPTTDTTDAP